MEKHGCPGDGLPVVYLVGFTFVCFEIHMAGYRVVKNGDSMRDKISWSYWLRGISEISHVYTCLTFGHVPLYCSPFF